MTDKRSGGMAKVLAVCSSIIGDVKTLYKLGVFSDLRKYYGTDLDVTSINVNKLGPNMTVEEAMMKEKANSTDNDSYVFIDKHYENFLLDMPEDEKFDCIVMYDCFYIDPLSYLSLIKMSKVAKEDCIIGINIPGDWSNQEQVYEHYRKTAKYFIRKFLEQGVSESAILDAVSDFQRGKLVTGDQAHDWNSMLSIISVKPHRYFDRINKCLGNVMIEGKISFRKLDVRKLGSIKPFTFEPFDDRKRLRPRIVDLKFRYRPSGEIAVLNWMHPGSKVFKAYYGAKGKLKHTEKLENTFKEDIEELKMGELDTEGIAADL